jgi:hypothetical protein
MLIAFTWIRRLKSGLFVRDGLRHSLNDLPQDRLWLLPAFKTDLCRTRRGAVYIHLLAILKHEVLMLAAAINTMLSKMRLPSARPGFKAKTARSLPYRAGSA